MPVAMNACMHVCPDSMSSPMHLPVVHDIFMHIRPGLPTSLLERRNDNDSAGEYFFHSFTGSVVYAHGNPLNIPKPVRESVGVLSDALFMVVCVHLLEMLACRSDDGSDGRLYLIADPTMECWTGRHATLSVIALIAYSVYVPLSIMLGTCG